MAGCREVSCCRSIARGMTELSSDDAHVHSVPYQDVLRAISSSRPEHLDHGSAAFFGERTIWRLASLDAEDFERGLATHQ